MATLESTPLRLKIIPVENGYLVQEDGTGYSQYYIPRSWVAANTDELAKLIKKLYAEPKK